MRADNPVPAARRSSGARVRRGLLGHLGPGRPSGDGRLVRAPRQQPEALEPAEVAMFVADLRTARDRTIALMPLGGLRAGEVRALRLAEVDQGLRRVRVTGKGGRQRVVAVDVTVMPVRSDDHGYWTGRTGRSGRPWLPGLGPSGSLDLPGAA